MWATMGPVYLCTLHTVYMYAQQEILAGVLEGLQQYEGTKCAWATVGPVYLCMLHTVYMYAKQEILAGVFIRWIT